jgi:hypothetical protein
MRPSALQLLLCLTIPFALAPAPAHAGGYLWLGAEYQGEGNIYRFNLATGMIDMVQAHAGVDHWNNMATGGGSLYLGHPTTDVLNRHDAMTGALISPGSYSTTLAGHKEDGAFHDGSLWRIAFSGASVLHRTTTAGVAETTFTGSNPGFVGIEFVGDTMFATAYGARTIGTLHRVSATQVTYNVRPWATGQQPAASHGALAWDADAESLYMSTNSDHLYRVWFDGGEAYSELVSDLSTVGYPAGGLVDPSATGGNGRQRGPNTATASWRLKSSVSASEQSAKPSTATTATTPARGLDRKRCRGTGHSIPFSMG